MSILQVLTWMHALVQDLASNRVFLYMKGDPAAPQCGFSQMACRILDAYGEVYLEASDACLSPEPDLITGADPGSPTWPPRRTLTTLFDFT
jgi:monothiol glutaredoxin